MMISNMWTNEPASATEGSHAPLTLHELSSSATLSPNSQPASHVASLKATAMKASHGLEEIKPLGCNDTL